MCIGQQCMVTKVEAGGLSPLSINADRWIICDTLCNLLCLVLLCKVNALQRFLTWTCKGVFIGGVH